MILDLWHDERIDDTETLTFEVPFDDVKGYLLEVDHEIEWRGRRFFIAEIEDLRRGDSVRKSVTCLALWYRLTDPTFVGSLLLEEQTVADGLATILDGTGWTVDPATTADPATFTMEGQDLTRLALLRRWAATTGTFLVWNTYDRTVALTATRGENRGVSFRYRRNLRGIRRRTRPPEATVLYPYGAQGLNIAGVNLGAEYLEDLSYYTDRGMTLLDARARFTRSRVWSDPSFLRDVDLLAAGQARMARLAAGLVTYEMDVVTLSDISGVSEPIEIGDLVLVADELLDANLTTTVVRHRQYPLEPWRDEVELGQLPDVLASSAASTREQQSESWTMFVSNNLAAYTIRNDGDFILNRLPLDFRPGGQAHWHLDFFATGVDAGEIIVEIVDAVTSSTVYRTLRVPYTDGQIVHASLQWAEVERSGQYDYRVKFTTEATGGASPSKGVDIAVDESRFFVLAIGAVQQTPPPAPSSIRFDYTGALQNWTVPADVTEIIVTAAGAQGGADSGYSKAGGGVVTATIPVTPGAVLDLYVGGSTSGNTGGWPDGGYGDTVAGSSGSGGGGSTRLIPAAGALSAALLVAAGGGGQGDGFTTAQQLAGGGGFFAGENAVAGGITGGNCPGFGATQYIGGTGGTGTQDNGAPGSFGQGGDGGDMLSSFGFPPGGGGGGWYGGGGGGADAGAGGGTGGGGGGGSGYVIGTAYDLTFEDGTNLDNGYIEISWTPPV